MTEVDNICYSFALGERVHARVEEAGRVELTDREAAALMRMKAVHVVTVVTSCLAAVKMCGSSLSVRAGGNVAQLVMLGMLLVPLGYWLGAVAEVYGSRLTGPEIAKHIGKALGLRLLSLIVCLMLAALSSFKAGGGGGFGNQS